ncbi:MAG: penicillin-binding protein activator LpoB [bacterium]
MARHRPGTRKLRLLALPLALLSAAGCGGTKVTRIDSDQTVDLSGQWNDSDSRMVSEEMIRDCLNQGWLRRHNTERSKPPVVIVGVVRNKSMEHIPVETFIKDIERAFINSGEVTVVADAGERMDIRAEREAMQDNVTPETLKQFGREVGADYVMTGVINQIKDTEGGEEISYYQTDLELINVESNVKVWLGQKKIKKYIERSGVKG